MVRNATAKKNNRQIYQSLGSKVLNSIRRTHEILHLIHNSHLGLRLKVMKASPPTKAILTRVWTTAIVAVGLTNHHLRKQLTTALILARGTWH